MNKKSSALFALSKKMIDNQLLYREEKYPGSFENLHQIKSRNNSF